MPTPVILIERTHELGRDPTSADFTLLERMMLCASLTSCIRTSEGWGDIAQADRLREHWTRCIVLGDPPRFPELQGM